MREIIVVIKTDIENNFEVLGVFEYLDTASLYIEEHFADFELEDTGYEKIVEVDGKELKEKIVMCEVELQ